MSNGNLALKLIDGTKADRDRYIDRVEVLDKVKKLITLPDGYIESKKVAEYYNVNPQNIRMIAKHRGDEFKDGEMIKYSSKNLLNYKEKLKSKGLTLKAINHLTVFSKKGALRIGMLLTNSPIAEKVRDYLLNVEYLSTKEQKENAFQWTKELDQYIFETIKHSIDNGESIIKTMKDIANEIGTTKGVIQARWYTGNKELKPLRDRLNKETKEMVAKGEHLKLVNNHQLTNNNDEMIIQMNELFKKQQETLLEVVSELHNAKTQNEKLYKGMGAIWRGYKELSESHNVLKNDFKSFQNELNEYKEFISEAYVEKTKILEKRIELQKNKLEANKKELQKAKMAIADNIINEQELKPKNQSFKMDRNGNLTKM